MARAARSWRRCLSSWTSLERRLARATNPAWLHTPNWKEVKNRYKTDMTIMLGTDWTGKKGICYSNPWWCLHLSREKKKSVQVDTRACLRVPESSNLLTHRRLINSKKVDTYLLFRFASSPPDILQRWWQGQQLRGVQVAIQRIVEGRFPADGCLRDAMLWDWRQFWVLVWSS